MNKEPKSPPDRMRDYRIEAQMRPTPDLHKLAQLFIGMAFSRADAERANQQTPPSSPRHEAGGEVES